MGFRFPAPFFRREISAESKSHSLLRGGGISLGPDLHLSRFERAGKRGIA
jgi:hypothetical protein